MPRSRPASQTWSPISPLAKPFTVRIAGVEYRVLKAWPKFWLDDTGRAHIGKLHTKPPPPTKLIRKSKPCSKCKKPAWTTTSRGRALHVSCEGFADTLPDDIEAQMIFDYAAYAGAEIL